MKLRCLLLLLVFLAPHASYAGGLPPKEGKVLVILTSNTELFGTGRKTGFWFEELATPYYALEEAGHEVVIASIRGGKADADPKSVDESSASVKRFRADEEAMLKLRRTLPLMKVHAAEFAAVLLPGGHGAMWDFAGNPQLRKVLQEFVDAEKPVAALSHGAEGLLELREKKRPLLKNKRVAVFTRDEEAAAGTASVVPGFLEAQMKANGAKPESAPPGKPKAIREENLITGQNAASSEEVAKLLLQALKEERKK